MAHKVSKIILYVDLGCSRCYKKIKEVLCKYRERYQIQDEKFDEKNNTVTISGPSCPHKLSKKLCCKAGKVIKCYKIVDNPGNDSENKPTETKTETETEIEIEIEIEIETETETEKPPPPPPPKADPQLVQQIVVYCGPSGYVPHPPCHCGCGRSPQQCSDGCGGPSGGCGRSQQQCSDGCGGSSGCVPDPPCHCGCGGSQHQCYNGCVGPPGPCYGGCERRSCRSSCEDPNACIVM